MHLPGRGWEPRPIHRARAPRRALRPQIVVLAVSSCVLISAWTAPLARASFAISPGSVTTTAAEQDGTVDSQAGSHPYEYTISFAFEHNAKGEVEGEARDVLVDLPAGLTGSPLAVPRCPRADFDGFFPRCPGDTQVGVLHAEIQGLGTIEAPVYELETPPGVIARFGFAAAGIDSFEDATLQPHPGGGYGIRLALDNIPLGAIGSVTETLWGVPPLPAHAPNAPAMNPPPNGSSMAAPAKPHHCRC